MTDICSRSFSIFTIRNLWWRQCFVISIQITGHQQTYDALKIYIDMDFDGLRSDIVQMLGGGRVKVNTCTFQNDMRNFQIKDDVLTLLIHLGYLGYDFETEEAFIPNKEISKEFENAINVSGWPEVMRVLKESENRTDALSKRS